MKNIKVNYHVLKSGLDKETYDRLKSLLQNNASIQQLLQFNTQHNIIPNFGCCGKQHIDVRESMNEAIRQTDILNEKNS